jgi:hypothetical protein
VDNAVIDIVGGNLELMEYYKSLINFGKTPEFENTYNNMIEGL